METNKNVESLTKLNAKDKTSDILSKLDIKIKSIKQITDIPYRTTGNLETYGNVKTEINTGNLLAWLGSVMARENSYHEAAKKIEVSTYPAYEISGGNSEDWTHDIKLRINIIEQKEIIDELNAIKAEFTSLMDKEDRKQLLLERAMKINLKTTEDQ